MVFPRDYFWITHILKAADRRIGLKRLKEHFQDLEQDSVGKVLTARRTINLCNADLKLSSKEIFPTMKTYTRVI